MDKFYIILIAIFCGINGLGIAYSHLLEVWGIENVAGMIGNVVLAAITALSYYFGTKGIKTNNHHRFIRQVYLSTFVKLFICAIGVLIYAFINRDALSLGTLILFFLLYILYTIVETWNLMKAAKTSSH